VLSLGQWDETYAVRGGTPCTKDSSCLCATDTTQPLRILHDDAVALLHAACIVNAYGTDRHTRTERHHQTVALPLSRTRPYSIAMHIAAITSVMISVVSTTQFDGFVWCFGLH